jgi:hypothetical protein
MRIVASAVTVLGATLLGCAHHQANQYAYAPPLAPPVYPQPQMATPMVAAAPVAAPAAVGVPMTAPAMAAAPVMGQPVAGPPVAGDPCCMPMDGGAVPVVYESADQTPACPPGP